MAETAVVIPFMGDFASLLPTLEALQAQTIRNDLLVIVSIDGSEEPPLFIDELVELSLNGAHAGPATARNRGWRNTPSEVKYILFTDSDCIPEPEWAERLVEKLKSNFQAVKGVYSFGGKKLIQRLSQVEFEERYKLMSKAKQIFLADTYSAGFRKNWLEKLDGFNEDFPLPEHEDVDLSWRLVEFGGHIGFEPAAKVEHKHRDSWIAYFKTKFRRGKWRTMLIKSYPSRAVSDGYTPQTLKMQMFSSIPLVVSFLFIRTSIFIPISFLFLFILLCLPLFIVAGKKDKSVTPIIPFFALWRGIALFIGFVTGIFAKKVK